MNSEAEEGAGPGYIPVPWIAASCRDGGPGREMRIPAVYPANRLGVKVELFFDSVREMKVIDHWLAGARRVESCNCDDRPDAGDMSLVVIHGISLPPGEFGGDWIECLFTNTLEPTAHPYFESICGLRVSAHALIRRDGEIVQFVPFHRRAWHAGVSNYQGRERCNDFSIGIELEGADDAPYADVQYERLADVLAALFAAYPGLSPDRVVGHSDIAPGRKTDPGPSFDWERLYRLLSIFDSPLPKGEGI